MHYVEKCTLLKKNFMIEIFYNKYDFELRFYFSKKWVSS